MNNKIMKREKAAKLKNLTTNPSLFAISPVYVLVISVFFIFTVFLMHICGRYEQNYGHMAVAVVVVIISMVFSFYIK